MGGSDYSCLRSYWRLVCKCEKKREMKYSRQIWNGTEFVSVSKATEGCLLGNMLSSNKLKRMNKLKDYTWLPMIQLVTVILSSSFNHARYVGILLRVLYFVISKNHVIVVVFHCHFNRKYWQVYRHMIMNDNRCNIHPHKILSC